MHRYLSTGPSTIAALMACQAAPAAPAALRDTTPLTTLLPDFARPGGHARRPLRDAARPSPAVLPRAATRA